MAIIALAFGCIVAGVVIDLFGVRKTFITGCALFGYRQLDPFYHSDVTQPAQLFLTYGSVGFFVGIIGGVPFVIVHAFPAREAQLRDFLPLPLDAWWCGPILFASNLVEPRK